MSKLSNKVNEYLKKINYPATVYQQGDLLELTGSGSNINGFTTRIVGKDAEKNKLSCLLILTYFPVKIPSNKREKIQYFFNELNKDFSTGSADTIEVMQNPGGKIGDLPTRQGHNCYFYWTG